MLQYPIDCAVAIRRMPDSKQGNSRRVGSGRGLQLDEPLPEGVADEPGGVVNVELRHDVSAMRLGGLHTDVEQLSDLLRGLALGDQLEDLALASGQVLNR